MPKRIQRKRSKGWKMPPNTVYVGRPTKFGNFWTPEYMDMGRKKCVSFYRKLLNKKLTKKDREFLGIHDINLPWYQAAGFQIKEAAIKELRGKNLACWCKEGEPCHADVLLEIANSD